MREHMEYLGWEIELVAKAKTNEGQVWVVEPRGPEKLSEIWKIDTVIVLQG